MEQKQEEITAKSKLHVHLSTAFIALGIVSFMFGIAVNYYTLKRLKN